MNRASATLAYGGCRIRVETSDPRPLAWLLEFFGPDADARPQLGGPVEHEVVQRFDLDLFQALERRGPHPSGQSIDAFALDREVVRLPLWSAPVDEVLAFDAPLATFYSSRLRGTRTELVASRDSGAARVALLRVVREVATAHAIAAGGLPVHAAAVAWNGRAFAIAGAKNAGKTTLLLHLLAGTGARYVANDRTVIWTHARPPRLRGMPTIVSIRPSSLAHFPSLAERVGRSGYHHRFTLDEAARGAATGDPVDDQGPTDLSPAQLARLLEVDRAAELPLGGLLFPRHVAAGSGVTLEALGREAAAVRLQGALLRAGAPPIVGALFAGPSGVPAPDLAGACAGLMQGIPALDCALGPDAYDAPGSALRLLGELDRLCG